jgi:hypothetical protein
MDTLAILDRIMMAVSLALVGALGYTAFMYGGFYGTH